MQKKDMKHLKLLKKLASFSSHHQHQMSCILVKRTRIISVGYNKVKTHPKAFNRYNMLHAEVSALLGVSYEDTTDCTAYIYRQQRNGTLAMARPCITCQIALKQAGIKKIIYTMDNTWKEECI